MQYTDYTTHIPTSAQLKRINHMRDFKLLLQCKWDLCFLGILLGIEWSCLTNVMGQAVGPMFFFLDCLMPADGTDRLTQNVSKKLPLYAT